MNITYADNLLNISATTPSYMIVFSIELYSVVLWGIVSAVILAALVFAVYSHFQLNKLFRFDYVAILSVIMAGQFVQQLIYRVTIAPQMVYFQIDDTFGFGGFMSYYVFANLIIITGEFSAVFGFVHFVNSMIFKFNKPLNMALPFKTKYNPKSVKRYWPKVYGVFGFIFILSAVLDRFQIALRRYHYDELTNGSDQDAVNAFVVCSILFRSIFSIILLCFAVLQIWGLVAFHRNCKMQKAVSRCQIALGAMAVISQICFILRDLNMMFIQNMRVFLKFYGLKSKDVKVQFFNDALSVTNATFDVSQALEAAAVVVLVIVLKIELKKSGNDQKNTVLYL